MAGLETNDGRLVVVAGASRSGKTAYTEKRIRAERRVCVWDPESQWAELRGFVKITSRDGLLRATLAARGGPARLAYVAGGDIKREFDFWAGVTRHWGTYHGPLVAVAEELSDVSSPGKAPAEWGMLLRRGLKRGISIFAVSQRWAEADKTAIGNASEFVLFRMSSGDDMAYMSRKTRVPVAELEALTPEYWDAERRKLKRGPYIRYAITGEYERGAVTFPKPRA